jgi:hypothetical protein
MYTTAVSSKQAVYTASADMHTQTASNTKTAHTLVSLAYQLFLFKHCALLLLLLLLSVAKPAMSSSTHGCVGQKETTRTYRLSISICSSRDYSYC